MVPSYLPDVIERIHAGMQEEQDPRHAAALSQCLNVLMKIQADYMGQNGAGSNARDALLSQLTGAGGGGQPVPQAQGQG